jgi:glycosyltransferase involved in cell wall biosynthesis
MPMGIDCAELAPAADPGAARAAARAALELPEQAFVVGGLGRLVPIKGFDLLLESLPPGAWLLLAGDGPERDRLTRAAHGRPVRLLGAIDPAARRRFFAALDVLAIPSRELPDGRTEGTPVTAIEALAAGVPLVASRTGGLGELLPAGAGILVPPGSARELAAALQTLATDPALRRRLAAAGPARAAAYDWEVLVPRLIDALRYISSR